MGLPGAHARPGIYPADCARPVFRRLHDQLALERVSGNSRAHLRPSLRAGVPARTRREGAGGYLPPEESRGRLQRRHPRPSAKAGGQEKRQAHRLDRRRPGLSDRRPRPRPARLPCVVFDQRSESRRHDPHADSKIPPAGFRDRRRDAATSSTLASNSAPASASTA